MLIPRANRQLKRTSSLSLGVASAILVVVVSIECEQWIWPTGVPVKILHLECAREVLEFRLYWECLFQ